MITTGGCKVAETISEWCYCGPSQAEDGDCERCGPNCCGTHSDDCADEGFVCNGLCDVNSVHPPETCEGLHGSNADAVEGRERAEYERLRAKYG